MNPQAREDVIRRCFAARAAKREKGLAALISENAVYIEPCARLSVRKGALVLRFLQ